MSDHNGPVIRATINSASQDEPSRGGFTGNFGVSRYQTGANEQPAPAVTPQPAPLAPTASLVGGVLRATTRTNAAGQTVTTHETAGSLQRASSGDLRTAESGPVFTSPGGRILMPDEIKSDSLVTINVPGREPVTTNVRAAISAGLISQSRGVYEGPTGQAPKSPAEQLDEANAQRLAEQEQAGKDTAPQVEPLDAQAEEIMTEAVAKIGNLNGAETVASLIDRGDVSDDLAGRLASALGTDPAGVRQRIDVVLGAMTTQAKHAMGGTGFDEIVEHARAANPKGLREAQLAQANEGTTQAYRSLALDYYATLADTPAGRELILSADGAKERGVFVDRGTNKTYVNIPGIGRVLWSVAVRQGHIEPHHRR
jgi:hypothetical protein